MIKKITDSNEIKFELHAVQPNSLTEKKELKETSIRNKLYKALFEFYQKTSSYPLDFYQKFTYSQISLQGTKKTENVVTQTKLFNLKHRDSNRQLIIKIALAAIAVGVASYGAYHLFSNSALLNTTIDSTSNNTQALNNAEKNPQVQNDPPPSNTNSDPQKVLTQNDSVVLSSNSTVVQTIQSKIMDSNESNTILHETNTQNTSIHSSIQTEYPQTLRGAIHKVIDETYLPEIGLVLTITTILAGFYACIDFYKKLKEKNMEEQMITTVNFNPTLIVNLEPTES